MNEELLIIHTCEEKGFVKPVDTKERSKHFWVCDACGEQFVFTWSKTKNA